MADSDEKNFLDLFGIRKRNAPATEEEIKDYVTDTQELREDEKRMIHEIIDLGDMSASEIMQPRVDMMMVEDTETVRQAIERMQGTGYSRLPVFHEDADHIVGIVHYKDLVNPILNGLGDASAADYAYEAMFVPESKDVLPLLAEMQTNRQQMAIVVDEYGGTDGLITIEDIVEEIVGEIEDETDRERPTLKQQDAKTWLVSGRFPVDDAIALGWPVEESEDYETMAGWVLDHFETVPQVGDSFDYEGFRFKVSKMRRSRILVVQVEELECQGQKESSYTEAETRS